MSGPGGPGGDPAPCSDKCKKSGPTVRVGMTKAGASGAGNIPGHFPGGNGPDFIGGQTFNVPPNGIDGVKPALTDKLFGNSNNVITNKPGGWSIYDLSVKVEIGGSTGQDGNCAPKPPPATTGCEEERGCTGSVGGTITVTGCDIGAGPDAGPGDLAQKNIELPPDGAAPVVRQSLPTWPPATAFGANGNTDARGTHVSSDTKKVWFEIQFGPHCGSKQLVVFPLFYPGTTSLIKGQDANGDIYYLCVELGTECSECS